MERRVIAPAFGRRLRNGRVASGLTMGQVVGRVHRLSQDLERFTRSQLSNYEQGFVSSPDPVLLLLLARLYGLKLEELLEELARDREHNARSHDPPIRPAARGGKRAAS